MLKALRVKEPASLARVVIVLPVPSRCDRWPSLGLASPLYAVPAMLHNGPPGIELAFRTIYGIAYEAPARANERLLTSA